VAGFIRRSGRAPHSAGGPWGPPNPPEAGGPWGPPNPPEAGGPWGPPNPPGARSISLTTLVSSLSNP
jgi:hypothetical protein